MAVPGGEADGGSYRVGQHGRGECQADHRESAEQQPAENISAQEIGAEGMRAGRQEIERIDVDCVWVKAGDKGCKAHCTGDNGKKYRAVFTNSCGTANSAAATGRNFFMKRLA